MILPIVTYPNPVLREKGAYVKEITSEVIDLVENMLETMYASGGVGLAANQVGKALRIAVIDVSNAKAASSVSIKNKLVPLESIMPLVMFNPRWEPFNLTKPVMLHEGCLSFPDTFAEVNRSLTIGVSYMGKNGKIMDFRCAGFLSQAIQHECDHLKGVLFIDYLTEEQRKPIEEKFVI
jgi:peptide deformylase